MSLTETSCQLLLVAGVYNYIRLTYRREIANCCLTSVAHVVL